VGTAAPLYDCIGAGYDATRRADPFLTERLRELLAVRGDGSYVDLACGTGNYTVALAAAGGHWAGVDCSPSMIALARPKSGLVRWHVGYADALPLPTNSAQGVVSVLAVHHFPDPFAAFAEVRRVLRRKGRFVVFTAGRAQMRRYWLNFYFPEAMARAIDQMPDLGELEGLMRRAGLAPQGREPYFVRPDLTDWFLYSGKHAPERCLDARVRAGISTFAALASPAEVAAGCRRLAEDLRSGRKWLRAATARKVITPLSWRKPLNPPLERTRGLKVSGVQRPLPHSRVSRVLRGASQLVCSREERSHLLCQTRNRGTRAISGPLLRYRRSRTLRVRLPGHHPHRDCAGPGARPWGS
jgi:ubiquinone/menaquinone biosynthesis C-methylase UbiE